MHENHIDQLPLPLSEVITLTLQKGLKKYEDKEQGKTKHEVAMSKEYRIH